MPATQISLRQQVLDYAVELAKRIPTIRGAEYGMAYDPVAKTWLYAARQHPWCWVYDGAELPSDELEPSTELLGRQLNIGFEIAFTFDPRRQGDLFRVGNSILAEAQGLFHRHYNFDGLIVKGREDFNDIQEIPDAAKSARVLFSWLAHFYRDRLDPYRHTTA